MLGVRVPPGLEKYGSATVFKKIEKYLKETAAEMRKMTWPSKDELIGSTIVTVVVSVIIAAFIGIVDRILLLIIQSIFGTGMGG